jgi:hypothetical protein
LQGTPDKECWPVHCARVFCQALPEPIGGSIRRI